MSQYFNSLEIVFLIREINVLDAGAKDFKVVDLGFGSATYYKPIC